MKHQRDAIHFEGGHCSQLEQQQQTLVTIGAGVAIAGTAATVGIDAMNASNAGKSASGLPSWNYNYSPVTPTLAGVSTGGTQSLISQYPQIAQLAQQETATQTALRNQVSPGSSNQMRLANQQLNSYIQGQVPQDVIGNTQRAIAQETGGGFNALTGGGQSPDAFARSIGQTSVGLSQFGLSAAPTWQQLAQSFVVSPQSAEQQGFQLDELNTQNNQFNAGQANEIALANQQNQMAAATRQYQAGMNQHAANVLGQQQQATDINQGIGAISGLGSTLVGIGNANNYGSYYSGLGNTSYSAPQSQSAANATLMNLGSSYVPTNQLPALQNTTGSTNFYQPGPWNQ